MTYEESDASEHDELDMTPLDEPEIDPEDEYYLVSRAPFKRGQTFHPRWPGPVDWKQAPDPSILRSIRAEEFSLGPMPKDMEFPALEELEADWTDDMVDWLSLPTLRLVQLRHPTQAALDALEQSSVVWMRLQRPKFIRAPKWPRIETLRELTLYNFRDLDLASMGGFPALKHVHIDGVRNMRHLDALTRNEPIRTLSLGNVRGIDRPESVWKLRVAKWVSVRGSASSMPWAVEAIRVAPQEVPDNIRFSEYLINAAYKIPSNHTSDLHTDDPDQASLTFETVMLPVADVVDDHGLVSTGHFWASLLEARFPDLAGRVEFDPETDRFAAYGYPDDLYRLQIAIEPLLTKEKILKAAIVAAQQAGVELH